ncbi:esterase, partial [Rhizobium leguminosarum]
MIGKRRGLPAALTGLLIATMALAGCGGRPVGVMQAAGTAAPGTSKVDLLVATTRAADDNPAVCLLYT